MERNKEYLKYKKLCKRLRIAHDIKYRNGLPSDAMIGVFQRIRGVEFIDKNFKLLNRLIDPKREDKLIKFKRLLKEAKDWNGFWINRRLKAKTEFETVHSESNIVEWGERIKKCEKNIRYHKKIRVEGKPVYNEGKSFNVERIKEIPLLDIVKSYGFEVKMAGSYRAFIKLRKNEKTPSCCIDVNKNTFRDYGGDAFGDVIDFVQLQERCDFREACEKLERFDY